MDFSSNGTGNHTICTYCDSIFNHSVSDRKVVFTGSQIGDLMSKKINIDTNNPIVITCKSRQDAEDIAKNFSCEVTQYDSCVATFIPVMPTSEFIVKKLVEHGYIAEMNQVGKWL